MHDYLKNVLTEQYGMEVTEENDRPEEYQVYAENRLIKTFITSPFDEIPKWQVRFSTVAAFDRWGNSCGVWEKFDTEIEVINYLKEMMFEIYEDLLKYLSNEYRELFDLLDKMEEEEYKNEK